MSNSKKLQVRIDEYAYGVWFDTVDIDPYSQTVRIYDHLFDKEQTFSDSDKNMMYREVGVSGMKITKELLRDFMFQSAFTNHYTLRIIDEKAMLYELTRAIDWYREREAE